MPRQSLPSRCSHGSTGRGVPMSARAHGRYRLVPATVTRASEGRFGRFELEPVIQFHAYSDLVLLMEANLRITLVHPVSPVYEVRCASLSPT